MFDKFYKLSGLPFLLTPDARFFFGSSGHGRAMAHLIYGLSRQEGFIVSTGEVGAGKTPLTEQLWCKQGRRCLLVIDEVQNLSLAAIKELRMLSNITVDGKASVQTILSGQPQFRPALASKDWEQLRLRVFASYHLGPLTEAETRGCIEHRPRTVGWRDDPVWEDAALTAIHRQADGIPRRINTLCSRVLLFGALEEAHTITGRMVDDTAEELNRDLGAGLDQALSLMTQPKADDRDDRVRRIEQLEHRAFRQEQLPKRVMDLLELNATGQV